MDPSSAADRRYALRKIESQFLDSTYFQEPIDFPRVLSTLTPAQWPPSEDQMLHLAHLCGTMLHALYRWESSTHGQDVVDVDRGPISTAHARRLLAQKVFVSDEGEVSVTFLDLPRTAEHGEVMVELRAFIDEERSLPGKQVLGTPEFVISWVEDEVDREVSLLTTRRGGHWYALEQLRDDLAEGRLPVS